MTDIPLLELAIAGVLGTEPGTVKVTGTASVGAVRQTVFLTVDQTPAVAQIASYVSEGGQLSQLTEAAIVAAVGDAGVPVPKVIGSGTDRELGTIVVTSRVDGVTVPRHVLRAVESAPELGPEITRQCGEALAALHLRGYDTLPGATATELTSSQGSAWIAQMTESLERLPDPYPVFRHGLRWLTRHLPDQYPTPAVVHGDLRNGNIIVDDHGLAAVLDWELTHLGDPMEDLAWLCLRTWRFGADANEVGGFGQLADLKDAYVQAGGAWRQHAFDWWTVARTIWWGLGLAGQANAFRRGDTDSIVLAASGRRVVELEYDLFNLIYPPGDDSLASLAGS